MEAGFPRKISEDFPGVEKVDAAFEAFGKRMLNLLIIKMFYSM